MRWWFWLGVAALGATLSFLWLKPTKYLRLVACDVGQGDAMLVLYGKTQVVIDGGPDDSVLDCLSRFIPFWERDVELVVLTHGDADHVTGLIEVLKRYRVEKLVSSHWVKDTANFRAFREAVVEFEVPVYAPQAGDGIRLDEKTGLKVTALWPLARGGDEAIWNPDVTEGVLEAHLYPEPANEQSLIFQLEYGDFDALLVGDAGAPTEEALVRMGRLQDVEVLKVGHHGSRFSSTQSFLEAVTPEVAIVSVGENTYGHPTKEALDRLEAVGARIVRTDRLGDIVISSDGTRFWVEE